MSGAENWKGTKTSAKTEKQMEEYKKQKLKRS
jgi:hypothetical protein